MSANEQIVVNTLLDYTIEEINSHIANNTIDIGLNEIYQAANELIDFINDLAIQDKIFIKRQGAVDSQLIVNTDITKKPISLQSFKEAMQNKNQINTIKLISQKVERFINLWNLFLDRDTYLVYIMESDGTPLFYNSVQLGKILINATPNKGRFNVSQRNILSIEDTKIRIQKEIDKATQNRKGIYREALERLNEHKWKQGSKDPIKGTFDNKEHNNRNQLKEKGAKGTQRFSPVKGNKAFYYKLDNQYGWSEAPINKGHIAEGYFRGIFDEVNKAITHKYLYTTTGFPSEQELGLKALAENYVHKDNVAEVVEGDINGIINGVNYHFNVKSGNFSTAQIGQYLRLAERLVAMRNDKTLPKISKEDFTKENIQLLIDYKKSSATILKIFKNKIIDSINQ